jgi:hypothetical protein
MVVRHTLLAATFVAEFPMAFASVAIAGTATVITSLPKQRAAPDVDDKSIRAKCGSSTDRPA